MGIICKVFFAQNWRMLANGLQLSEFANYVTTYFPIKIKIFAKEKFEFAHFSLLLEEDFIGSHSYLFKYSSAVITGILELLKSFLFLVIIMSDS